jgi:trigger factor
MPGIRSCPVALSIKSDVKETSPVERELTVAVAGDAVAKELDKAYRKLAQKVRLKGYRPGKVPRYVLEQYYKADTEQGVLEKILNDSFRQAIADNALQPVADPAIKAAGELLPGVDYTYTATVEIKPEIEIKAYKGLKLEKTIYTVKDDAIDAQIQAMRERQVEVTPVEDRDTVQQGDLVEANFSGAIDGEAVRGLGGVSYVIEVGGGRFYPEAEQALVGKKLGEQFDVDVAIPDDHRVEAARGKTATLSIKPSEIKVKVLPALDDDFAQDISDDYKTVDDLKAGIKKDLEDQAERRSKQELHNKAIDALIEANPFEVPKSLVERQAQQMAAESLQQVPQQLAERLWASQGEKLTEEARPRALRSVRGGLLIEKLIEVEGIEVSDEEMEQKFSEIAVSVGQSKKQVKQLYQRQNAVGDLEHQLASEKLLARVVEAADITEKEAAMAGEDTDG